jgi:integrase
MFSIARVQNRPEIKCLEENNVRTGFFEWEEFVTVREALPDYLRTLVTFAYFTGWRKREILSLNWEQVDMEAQLIRLDPGTTKNKAGRQIALEGELLIW